MSRKTTNKRSEELPEEEVAEKIEAVELPAPPAPKQPKAVPVKTAPRPPRRVSFEQWATARSIKEHHKGGLKAFVSDPQVPRSYENWDKAFVGY